jgi:hypothetical protein
MSGYSGLHFPIAKLRAEIECLGKLAKPFLDTGSEAIIGDWKSALTNIETVRSTASHDWQIAEATPLKTIKTRGYEPVGRKVKCEVWGELSFVWSVHRVSLTKKESKGLLCLDGRASTKVRICREFGGRNVVLAQWQVEVGSHDSPGWHFHVGLCNESEVADDARFPKWLSVPRVPGLLVAPTDALDFLLGELFQDDWKAAVSNDGYDNVILGAAQKNRIQKMAEWHTTESQKAGHGSAWNQLKHRQPPAGIFLT